MNKFQDEILKCYKEFKRVCDKHNLRYYAIAGTCLGVVRHGGFIPWDDDMDVAMPYEDFLKFLKIAKEEMRKPYEVICAENNDHYTLAFAKVHNTDTTYIESGEIGDEKRYKGFFLDVMPLMGVPENKWKSTYRKLSFLKFCDVSRRMTFESIRYIRFKRRIPAFLGHVIFCVFPRRFFFNKRQNILKKSDLSPKNAVLCVWRTADDHRPFSYPYRIFGKGAELKFENVAITVPAEYKEYLTMDFGDYMKLPPKEKQVFHHDITVLDFDKSFRDYSKEEVIGKFKEGKNR